MTPLEAAQHHASTDSSQRSTTELDMRSSLSTGRPQANTTARGQALNVLPPDAIDSGHRQRNVILYFSANDDSGIYLDFGDAVERWPLDPQTLGCA